MHYLNKVALSGQRDIPSGGPKLCLRAALHNPVPSTADRREAGCHSLHLALAQCSMHSCGEMIVWRSLQLYLTPEY